jgi:hypothetical protein
MGDNDRFINNLFHAMKLAVPAVVIAFIISAVIFMCVLTNADAQSQTPATEISKKTLYVGYNTYQIALKNVTASDTVTYSSKDNSVASVSSAGVVTPVKKGTSKLTVTIKHLEKTYTSYIAVTVKNPYLSIANKPGENTLVAGSDYRLIPKRYGFSGTAAKWYSSNCMVARIDVSTGMIHARSAGTTKITCVVKVKNNGSVTAVKKYATFILTVADKTDENKMQVYLSTLGFKKNTDALSDNTDPYIEDIIERIDSGESITLKEYYDYYVALKK